MEDATVLLVAFMVCFTLIIVALIFKCKRWHTRLAVALTGILLLVFQLELFGMAVPQRVNEKAYWEH